MPVAIDKTVVASAYNTSGNGGRKLVRLDNGTLISAVKNGTATALLYKSINNGTSWTNIYSFNVTNLADVSIVTNGTLIYLLYSYNNVATYNRVLNENGTVLFNLTVESPQTAIGNVSLAINKAKTELHATWASKNSLYPNAFNIRYAKGVIQVNGSVVWDAVIQMPSISYTAGNDYSDPSITLNHLNLPVILCSFSSTNSNYIYAYENNGSGFRIRTVYSGVGYVQYSPSAIFVPKEINGLANGRIWVAWHGRDSSHIARFFIRVSYSDDNGVTWSTTQMLTDNSNNRYSTSLTANIKNEIFLLYMAPDYSTSFDIVYRKNTNGSWGSQVRKTTGSGTAEYPSALYDPTLDFTEPLFIYKDTAKVGFYGAWTITDITFMAGFWNKEMTKDDLRQYFITTDGEMSTITEKVNGVVVATKTATSEERLGFSFTQEQWDTIRYGKFSDTTGKRNTLTIEMGLNKWEYTFDKRLSTSSDLIDVAKSIKDTNEVFVPTIKDKLVSAINSKGGIVTGNTFEDIENAINGISIGKKFAIGTGTSYASAIMIRGLDFQPAIVVVKGITDTTSMGNARLTAFFIEKTYMNTSNDIVAQIDTNHVLSTGTWIKYSDGFSIQNLVFVGPTKWFAIE